MRRTSEEKDDNGDAQLGLNEDASGDAQHLPAAGACDLWLAHDGYAAVSHGPVLHRSTPQTRGPLRSTKRKKGMNGIKSGE